MQSISGQLSCTAVLYKWGKAPSAACALCGHHAEPQSHCLCLALKGDRIRAHHKIALRLWKGIKYPSRGWTIVSEQRAAGLLGLSQQEDQMGEWQRSWDEIEDMHLGGEGEPVDADAALRRKRSDAWAVKNWDKRCLLVLEFTRPNDRCELSL